MCRGVTPRGTPCGTRSVAEYCRHHANQEQLALYAPPSHLWPSTRLVASKVSKMELLPIDRLATGLRRIYTDMTARNPDPTSTHAANCECIILTIELLKVNANVCHGNASMQGLVGALVKRIAEVPELSAYANDFKLRCLKPVDVIELTVLTESECPICLDEYVPVASAQCGHHACATCCRGMLATGRTLTCPLCRDDRFRALVKRLSK
jgi:hypothetical protein